VEAVTGSPDKALARQRGVALVHWETFAWEDISRPLSEWLRLSGACDAPDEFEHAEKMFEEAKALGALKDYGLAYVELSWARAAVMLSLDRGDELARVLQRLASNAVMDSVYWSSTRWLARLYRRDGQLRRAQEQVDRLGHEDNDISKTRLLLAQIDDSLMAGRRPSADALDQLHRLQPGIVTHLLHAAPTGSEAEYVTRFYPY
jgi:hypothetical protein